MMEAFGSTNWPDPLLPTDEQINGPKGNLMNLNAPANLGGIGRLARAAVREDTITAADNVLSEVRIVCHRLKTVASTVQSFTDLSQIFAIFEYMNTNDFATRFNLVRNQVAVQLRHIEQATGVQHLEMWWQTFTADYFSQIENWAQSWADQAITAAAAPYVNAHNNGRNLQTYNQVMNTLQHWQGLLGTLTFPPYYYIPPPQPPGGGGS